MKKSVVVLIGIIYVASIAVVSFFGLQFKVFNEVIPVESIEILNEGLKYNETWGNYVVIYADEDGLWRYKIDYRVHPDNASNDKVSFTYDDTNTNVTVDDSGLVVFTAPGSVKVFIIATDGSNVQETVTIIAK